MPDRCLFRQSMQQCSFLHAGHGNIDSVKSLLPIALPILQQELVRKHTVRLGFDERGGIARRGIRVVSRCCGMVGKGKVCSTVYGTVYRTIYGTCVCWRMNRSGICNSRKRMPGGNGQQRYRLAGSCLYQSSSRFKGTSLRVKGSHPFVVRVREGVLYGCVFATASAGAANGSPSQYPTTAAAYAGAWYAAFPCACGTYMASSDSR